MPSMLSDRWALSPADKPHACIGGGGGGGGVSGEGSMSEASAVTAIATSLKGLKLEGPKQVFDENNITLPRRPGFGSAGRVRKSCHARSRSPS